MERRKVLKKITEICRKHKHKNIVKVNYWNLEISTLKSRNRKKNQIHGENKDHNEDNT